MATEKVKRDPRAASDVDREIGARIRARRLEIGMSQERLADALGVTFQQVQKYEKGTNRVSARTLYEISTKLEVQVTTLLPKMNVGVDELIIDTPDFGDLCAVFTRLSPDDRDLLIATARTFAETAKHRRRGRK